MKKLMFIFMLAIFGFSHAQQQVSGKILDDQGVPLPGASIVEKGTTNGTQSDFDGNYTLEVGTANATLVCSYIGYASQEVNVQGRGSIEIVLQEDASQLDEVVVVGYGTQAKKDITGSIATIESEAITERSTTNISNALQGAVSGVVVTRSSGEPGSGNTIRIRGNTTLQGSNSPLILVDDVPVSNINVVPADQVESITVLKDGAAAAIYGSRAAAGVIIVTTKRAKAGVISARYTGEYIVNTPSEKRDLVDDPVRYMENINERIWNDNGNDANQFPLYTEETINAYRSGAHLRDRDAYPFTDWGKLLLKKSWSGVRHNINVSGGSENVRTSFSAGYEKQDALYALRNWTRYTARLNNDLRITENLGAVADVAFRHVKDERPGINPIESALNSAPIFNAFHQDGRLGPGRSGGSAYGQLISGSFENSDTYNLNAKVGLFYKPVDGLKIALNFAPNITFSKYKNWTKPQPYWEADDPGQINQPLYINNIQDPSLIESRRNENQFTKQALVTYNKAFGEHSLNLVAGYEDFTSETEVLGVRAREFISHDFPFLNQAPADKVFNFDYNGNNQGTRITELAYASTFGRLDYNFDSRYYIGASIRRDGSSRFGSDYRWGTFPSISAAWTVSNEKFMESLDAVSYLKLKASYGELGNDRLGNYLYLSVLQISKVLIDQGGSAEEVNATAQRFLTTPDIKWETTASKNFGLELGLFDNRLSLEGEYYQKETTDMLLSLSVPDVVGFDDPTVNVGSMTTNGWEASATWNDRVGDDFSYSLSFNISDSKSIIGNINDKRLFNGITLSEEGHEFRELYGLRSEGLYQAQEDLDNSPKTSDNVKLGDVKYKDLSGPDGTPDGVINDFDREFLGSSLDRYTYGGRITMDYKGFDFGLTFQGVGKKNFHLNQQYLANNPEVQKLSVEYADNYWSLYNTPEENLRAKYPRYSLTSRGNNFRFSDYWISNGAYLRIKNLSFGYTLPEDLFEKLQLSGIRLYVTGNDLFSFHSLPKGIDPELGGPNSYFITKSIIMGLQVSF